MASIIFALLVQVFPLNFHSMTLLHGADLNQRVPYSE